jgi:hypothetical protein
MLKQTKNFIKTIAAAVAAADEVACDIGRIEAKTTPEDVNTLPE